MTSDIYSCNDCWSPLTWLKLHAVILTPEDNDLRFSSGLLGYLHFTYCSLINLSLFSNPLSFSLSHFSGYSLHHFPSSLAPPLDILHLFPHTFTSCSLSSSPLSSPPFPSQMPSPRRQRQPCGTRSAPCWRRLMGSWPSCSPITAQGRKYEK